MPPLRMTKVIPMASGIRKTFLPSRSKIAWPEVKFGYSRLPTISMIDQQQGGDADLGVLLEALTEALPGPRGTGDRVPVMCS